MTVEKFIGQYTVGFIDLFFFKLGTTYFLSVSAWKNITWKTQQS